MKKYLPLPILTLFGGAAAFVLRLLQQRTGFEADTGLPVTGNPYGYVLIALLLGVTLALFLLGGVHLPDEKNKPANTFTDSFSTYGNLILTVLVSGIFLLGASGVSDLYHGLIGSASRLHAVQGLLTLLVAGSLFPVIPACRRSGAREASNWVPPSFNGALLLVPVVYLVIRLVLTYRVDSVNPAVSAYYVELLALVFSILGFYRLSSFAFQSGRTRRFALCAELSIVLCLATLGDGHALSVTLLYLGSALIMLGFLLLRMEVLSTPWDQSLKS